MAFRKKKFEPAPVEKLDQFRADSIKKIEAAEQKLQQQEQILKQFYEQQLQQGAIGQINPAYQPWSPPQYPFITPQPPYHATGPFMDGTGRVWLETDNIAKGLIEMKCPTCLAVYPVTHETRKNTSLTQQILGNHKCFTLSPPMVQQDYEAAVKRAEQEYEKQKRAEKTAKEKAEQEKLDRVKDLIMEMSDDT